MIIKPVLIFVFWALAVYGMFDVARRTRKMRMPRKYKEFIFAWKERSVPDFQADMVSWLTTLIHWIVVFVVGLIEFFTLAVRPWSGAAPSFLFISLIGGLFGGIGYMWGAQLFTPIALSFAGNRHCALSTEGVLYGGNLIPWGVFSHFSVDRENNIIHLWSSSFRGAVAFVFTPPAEYFTKIAAILKSYLPDENTVPLPGPLWQAFPLIAMSLCCMPFLIGSLLTVFLSTEIALLVNGGLLYALMILGGSVLLWVIFGGKMRSAAVEPQ